MKRGQVSLAIIVAVVVLLVFFFLAQQKPELMGEQVDYTGVQNYFGTCLRDTAKTGILLMGIQGGFIFTPELSYETDMNLMGYHVYNEEFVGPTIESMQNELDEFIEIVFPDCAAIKREFFKSQGIRYSVKDVQATSVIREDAVVFRVETPTTIYNDGRESTLPGFEFEVPIPLGSMYSLANKIAEENIVHPDVMMRSGLLGYGYDVDITPFTPETTVYYIRDIEGRIPYVYTVPVHHRTYTAPVIKLPETLTANLNTPFTYKIDAYDPDGDALMYSDDSILFDVTDGMISFMPDLEGDYDVWIRVTDSTGLWTEENVKVVVR